MSTQRYCLIGLPRCGSQYISDMIVRNSKSKIQNSAEPWFNRMQNLAEPFTYNHPYSIDSMLSNNQKINYLFTVRSDFTKYNSHREQIDYVFNILKKADQKQSLILKVFLGPKIFPFLSEILDELAALNFKFIIIKRENIEYQLLSWLVGCTTDKWNSIRGFGVYSTPIYIPNEILYHHAILPGIYKTILNFDEAVKKYKIDTMAVGRIRYEHAVEDLSNLFSMPIKNEVKFKKQLPDNPYDMIENAEEVRIYLNMLMSKTKEQLC